MDNKNIALSPIKKLDEEIIEVLNKELNNKELLTELNNEYSKKGLNLKTISCLFDESKEVQDMDIIEKIAFTEVCKSVFEKQGKNWSRKFDSAKYFSQQDLMAYDTYIKKEEPINEMYFINCKKYDNFNYRGDITGRQVYEYMKNMLLRYNKNTQRATTLSKLGTKDMWVRKISLNKKSVREMVEKIKNKTFEETEVIFNVRLMKGKTPQIEFEESEMKGIGNLSIIPNYDRESKTTTYVEILDGYHRLTAIAQAVEEYYNEHGEWLEVSIGFKLVLADQSRALRIVEDTFKRSDTDKRWLNAIRTDDTGVFVDEIVKNSRYLKDNIAIVYKESIAFHKITYRGLLLDTVKKLNINVSDVSDSNFLSLEIAEQLDKLITVMNRNVDKEEYKYIYNPNMFAGYVKVAYDFTKKEVITMEDYKNVFERLKCLTSNEVEDLKLNTDKVSLKKIFDLFDDILEG